MERAKVVKGETVEHDTRFLAVYMETRNSCLILLSEREDRLGTLAIAVPKSKDFPGPPPSSVLLGDKNLISARMFAEYLAAKMGRIALVSIYLERTDEKQAQSIFSRLIGKIIHNETKEEGVTT
jgi:hypothetical protein